MKNYTDVASEIITTKNKNAEKQLEYGCKSVLIKIDSAKKEQMYNKPRGEYYSIFCDNLFYLAPIVTDFLAKELSIYLRKKIQKLTKKSEYKVLVACLGNGNIVSDSLGEKVFEKLIVSNQNFSSNSLYAISTGVFGKTNIKSVEYIEAIVKKIKPDICLVVDALCSSSISRIGSCIQVCDSGILAGGAVNRENHILISKKTLGVPTLCIGVPLVVRIESIFNDFIGTLTNQESDEDDLYSRYKNVIVAPKNIDILVKQSSTLLSQAINSAVLNISKKEQEMRTF